MTAKRWQDWVNLILGVWLFISPWALGFSGNATASWNAWIVGIAIVAFAAATVSMPQVWEEVVNIGLGVWLVVSPWALKITGERNAEIDAVIVGLLVIVLAAWSVALRRPSGTPEQVTPR